MADPSHLPPAHLSQSSGYAAGDGTQNVGMPSVVFLGNAASTTSSHFLGLLHARGYRVLLAASTGHLRGGKSRGLWGKAKMALLEFSVDELARYAALQAAKRWMPGEFAWLVEHDLERRADVLGIPYRHFETINGPEAWQVVGELSPDYLFVHSFSQIVGRKLIACARLGAFNFHPGALPGNRGSNPLEWTVLTGASETTTTCHELTADVDAGAVLAEGSESLLGCFSFRELRRRNAVATARCLDRVGDLLQAGAPELIAQRAEDARYHPRATAMDKYRARAALWRRRLT